MNPPISDMSGSVRASDSTSGPDPERQLIPGSNAAIIDILPACPRTPRNKGTGMTSGLSEAGLFTHRAFKKNLFAGFGWGGDGPPYRAFPRREPSSAAAGHDGSS